MNKTEEISKREKTYHDLLISDDNIKKDILSIIESDTDLTKLNLIHEDRYINGIIADFTCVYNNEIKARNMMCFITKSLFSHKDNNGEDYYMPHRLLCKWECRVLWWPTTDEFLFPKSSYC